MAQWRKVVVSGSNSVLNQISASGDIVPISDAGSSLGSTTREWNNLYVDGTANIDSLVADVTTVTTSNTVGANVPRFFDSIVEGAKFQARREERLSSTHFFCRAGNKEFNFSNNPTFFTGSTGEFTNATFFKDPKSYITTVGLYNDANELLAVAKLSQPVLKSYSREALIKVKLDF